MADLPPPFRRAVPDDAPVLAELMNLAGEGLPLYLWSRMAAPGESPWEVGRRRARRDEGAFSWRNAVVADEGSGAVATLLGYPLPDRPEPVPEDLPALFRPLQELEDLACGTWYVNVLATLPAHRGRGYGTRLLALAQGLGRAAGRQGLSLIVADANASARRLYARAGFREAATRPMAKEDWESTSESWVLMRRD